MTRSAAVENAALGITANAIAPGPVDTPVFHATGGERVAAEAIASSPIGRLIRPEEVAALAVYLLSEVAAAVTGATLDINGGINTR